MKTLLSFINEQLRPEIKKWFDKILDNMKLLVKDNKIQPIDIDIKKLSKPKKDAFEYDDFINDNTIKEIINNDLFGFTVTAQLIKNANNYLFDKDNENELEIKCLPYWYQQDDGSLITGRQTVDIYRQARKSVIIIDNYINIFDIETSLCVSKSLPVLKAILNDFSLHFLNKKGSYLGLTAKPKHPKMKAILIKLGFNISNDNKEILIYKF